MSSNDRTRVPVLRDSRGGLAYIQYPDQLEFIPDAAAWTHLEPGDVLTPPFGGLAACLVTSGSLTAGAREILPFEATIQGAESVAGEHGATVAALIRGSDAGAPLIPSTALAGVRECRVVELARWGGWTSAQSGRDMPFSPQRAYFLYDVPAGAERGAHAHIALHQLIVAVSGSFTIELDDGTERRTERLSAGLRGLYVPPGLWRDLRSFGPDSVCMVLASHPYDAGDYLRDHDQFRSFRAPRD